MARVGSHEISDYWDLIYSEEHSRIVLDPESFYLLLSRESVRVPPIPRLGDDGLRSDQW